MAEQDNVVRKTIVTRTIGRKINTAPYETLDVGGTWQQEIEWSNKDELWQKTRAFDKYIESDFNQTFNSVTSGLGLHSLQEKTAKENENKSKNQHDFDGLN